MGNQPNEAAEALHVAAAARDDICDLVIARVRLLAAMRAAWLHHLYTVEDNENNSPLSRITINYDHPKSEAEWRQTALELEELHASLEHVQGKITANGGSRLGHLERVFGLDAQSVDILHFTLAYELDEGLASILRHLAGDRGGDAPTARLAARIFGWQGTGLWRDDSPLTRWRIVELGADVAGQSRLILDHGICDWLYGGPLRDLHLSKAQTPIHNLEPLDHWPVAETAEKISHLLKSENLSPIRVAVSGPEGVGRLTFCGAVTRQTGLTLLALDASVVNEAEREELAVRAHRYAFIAHAALAWRGAGARPPYLPADLVPFPIEFVVLDAHQGVAPRKGRTDLYVALDMPDAQTRARLWRHYCYESAAWSDTDINNLSLRHRATPGRIAAAAAQRPGSPDDASAALNTIDRNRFGKLAQHLPCPFVARDLVLPARLSEQLETFLHEARGRTTFWERPASRRLFPYGRGLAALFTGPPGTGKTMAAQVISGALGLDLFRVDLSSLVSKYVGETAENIQRILSEAAAMDAVILFDEADGLFARRTDVSDAHDRYANTDTGHLLQAIECHEGIVILASNRKRNIDEAFLRRLRYVVHFPAPDEQARFTIWNQVLAELAGDAATRAHAATLKRISQRVALSGAQIKNATLTAIFAAERNGESLCVQHILRGIDSELMKEGSALSERDLQQLEGRA